MLEDNWNYMFPIFVPYSAEHIATQILVIVKLNGRKDFLFRDLVCDIIRPYKKLPVQETTWSTRITFENYARLRTKTLERCQWRRSSVCIVNCEHISISLINIEFEQAMVSWVNIDEIKYFWRQDQVYHVLCCSNLSVTKIY